QFGQVIDVYLSPRRVITLIHRQEAFSFFGLQFARFIDVDDSEQILRAIELTDRSVPIDLIVHTPGGLVFAARADRPGPAPGPGRQLRDPAPRRPVHARRPHYPGRRDAARPPRVDRPAQRVAGAAGPLPPTPRP